MRAVARAKVAYAIAEVGRSFSDEGIYKVEEVKKQKTYYIIIITIISSQKKTETHMVPPSLSESRAMVPSVQRRPDRPTFRYTAHLTVNPSDRPTERLFDCPILRHSAVRPPARPFDRATVHRPLATADRPTVSPPVKPCRFSCSRPIARPSDHPYDRPSDRSFRPIWFGSPVPGPESPVHWAAPGS